MSVLKSINVLFESQMDCVTLPVDYRKGQLSQLVRYLKEHEDGIIEALKLDFVVEFGARQEILKVMETARKALASIDEWMGGKKVSTSWSLLHLFDQARINYDPLGVVLIIGSWNVPLMTILDPLIGAIAAGCCAVIKPSEISSNTAKYLQRTLPNYMDPNTFYLFTGGAEETGQLIQGHKWDLIFFTGSERVGRLIYQQAALNLTPVVLELGGKTPVFVLGGCEKKLQLAADRLVWGKLIKAGQICISPDYVLVEERIYDKFLGCLLNSFNRMCGLGRSPDLDLIVSQAHFDRLLELRDNCGGTVLFEGVRSREDRYFGPVLVSQPDMNSSLMREEIFGPILPVVKVKGYREGIEMVNGRPKPLMLYVFGEDTKAIKEIKLKTRSGNFMANDTVLSFLVDDLPFGGVGASGIGAYHGRHSFETFSHSKACLERKLNLGWLDESLRFPPLTKAKINRLFWVAFQAPRLIKGISLVFLFIVALTLIVLVVALYVKA